jgi:hypothetical protein
MIIVVDESKKDNEMEDLWDSISLTRNGRELQLLLRAVKANAADKHEYLYSLSQQRIQTRKK